MLLLIYKYDIPLKLTIAKGLVLWEEMLPWGLKSSYLYIIIGLYIYIGIALFISIFYFCSLLRPLFFYDSGSRLSIIWLFTVQRYGGSVRYQTPGMPYSAKTFPERLPQMLHTWVFQKTFYRIVWCSDSWEPPFLYARKKATWWRDDGMIKKISDRKEQKTVKGNESSNPE